MSSSYLTLSLILLKASWQRLCRIFFIKKKSMQKEMRDLQRFSGLVSPPNWRKWVPDELQVVAESKEVAGDLITDVVLDQVFGEKAFEKFGKGFISMHFSDQHLGSAKKMLVFKFALPDANNMADMTRLVALVPYYIDLIGKYKLRSHISSSGAKGLAVCDNSVYDDFIMGEVDSTIKNYGELFGVSLDHPE